MPENTEYDEDKDKNTADFNQETDNLEDQSDESEDSELVSNQEIDPIETYKTEIAELKDKYLRLYADFENFRRRTSKEKLDLFSNANAEMIQVVLPIVDDFERAKHSFDTSSDIEAIKEGIDLIYIKLFKTLESKGLRPMDSKGETFDPEIHESIAQFPAPSEDLKGKVIDEVEKGYFLNDKVIRYAKVVVGA